MLLHLLEMIELLAEIFLAAKSLKINQVVIYYEMKMSLVHQRSNLMVRKIIKEDFINVLQMLGPREMKEK